MATLAELVVRLSGDSSKLVAELAKGEHGVKQFARQSEGALRSVGKVAVGALAGLGVAAVGAGAAVGVLGFQFNDMREKAQLAFTTMLGDGLKAKAFLDELQEFAAKTPFGFPELVSASQKLLAMGFSSEKVLPTLTAIGDAVAGLGGGGELIDQVTRALGQMQAKGKASGEEMLQLTEAGIPAWEFLAQAIGKSVPDAMKMVTKGAVDADTVIGAVVAGMNAKFGGLMAAQAETWGGMVSTIKDSVQILAGEISGPAFEAAKAGLKNLLEGMDTVEFKQSMIGVKEAVRDLTEAVVAKLGEFRDWFTDNKQEIKDFFTEVKDTAGVMFDDFLTGISTIGPPFKDFAAWLYDNEPLLIASIIGIGAAITLALGPVSGTVFAITGLITLIGAFRNHWRDMAAGVLGTVQSLANGIIGVMNGIIDAVTGAIEFAINPLLELSAMFGKGPGPAALFKKSPIPEVDLSGLIERLQGDTEPSRRKSPKDWIPEDEMVQRAFEQGRAAVAGAADAPRGGGGGGSGGGGGAASSLEAVKKLTAAEEALAAAREHLFDTLKDLQQDFLDEQIAAYLRGGQAAVDVTKAQQQEMLASAKSMAQDLMKTFGIALPDALKAAMDFVRGEAERLQSELDEAARTRAGTIASVAHMLGGSGMEAGALSGVLNDLNRQLTGLDQERLTNPSGVAMGSGIGGGSGYIDRAKGVTNYGTIEITAAGGDPEEILRVMDRLAE